MPVVFHDDDLDRTTNACQLWGGTKIKLTAKSLAELRSLDAGSWFDTKFAGTRIPTLDEALDTIQNGSMTLIERKEGDPATCVELLNDKKLLDQVVVQVIRLGLSGRLPQAGRNLVIAALGHKEVTPEKLDQIAKTGARIVGWEDKHTNASTIAAIHDRGWKAWVWTVDDPRAWRRWSPPRSTASSPTPGRNACRGPGRPERPLASGLPHAPPRNRRI